MCIWMTRSHPKHVLLQYHQRMTQLHPRQTKTEGVNGSVDAISRLRERDVCFEKAAGDWLVGVVGKIVLDTGGGDGEGMA